MNFSKADLVIELTRIKTNMDIMGVRNTSSEHFSRALCPSKLTMHPIAYYHICWQSVHNQKIGEVPKCLQNLYASWDLEIGFFDGSC